MVTELVLSKTNPEDWKPLIWKHLSLFWVSLVIQTVKNLATVQEMWVQSLGLEDLLQKGMATHSSILVWRIS